MLLTSPLRFLELVNRLRPHLLLFSVLCAEVFLRRSPFGEIHVAFCMFLCLYTSPLSTKSFRNEKSAKSSPFSFILPRACRPIIIYVATFFASILSGVQPTHWDFDVSIYCLVHHRLGLSVEVLLLVFCLVSRHVAMASRNFLLFELNLCVIRLEEIGSHCISVGCCC